MIRNVLEYLKNTVQQHPDKIAIVDNDKQISFGDLDQRAKEIATEIVRLCGNIKNEPIAVYMEKSIESIACFLGVLYSGNFYCPIDINSPVERIEKIIDVLQPKVFLCKDDIVFEKNVLTIRIDKIKDDGEHYVNIPSDILDVDPVYVLFTSGSTGQPKGVVINHRGVIDYIEWLTKTFQFDENTIFGNQAPFYFDNSILDIYSTLKNASTMVIIPEKKFIFPKQLIEYVNEKKINTIFWVPSALIAVANSGILENINLPWLKKILFCGEIMPNKQLNIWRKYNPEALYANLYGPTEITDVCSYYIVNRKFVDNEPLPIGTACENTEIIILNGQNKLVDIGEIGELCVRGSCLSMGYYRQTEKTENVFIQNPLNDRYREYIYRTGDLAKYNSIGEIIYIGRKDFQIKYQGHRIELGEIEAAAIELDNIQQSCAIYDEEKKQIVLFVLTDGKKNEKEIYQKMKSKLPHYMLPSKIFIVNEIPLNVNGKIDRNKLKRMNLE